MTVKTYDSACFNLARYFLSDTKACKEKPELHLEHCHLLALAIQQAVEDWFEEEKPEGKS